MEVLKGKVAVVTGASEGIGEAIVRRLAAEGMRVAALAKRFHLLTELENDLRSKGFQVNGYVCDVRRESQVKDAFERIDEDFGGITIMVNNASDGHLVNLLDINLEHTASVFNTNVLGAVTCTKEALASMKEHDITDGHIININSIAGHRGALVEHSGMYSASKHALRMLTDCLRADIVRHKLKTRVTSISPGAVKTSITKNITTQHPNCPFLTVDNIADALVYAVTVPHNVNISEMIIDPV